MVSRTAAVKFSDRIIDNLRMHILTKNNYRMLISSVFLVR